MDDEYNSGLPDLVYTLFFKGHTWPEYLFLYLVIQLALKSKFEASGWFDMCASYIRDKEDDISLILAKPFFITLTILGTLLATGVFIFLLTIIASLAIEYIPSILPSFKIGHMTVNGDDFRMPEFSIRKMLFEGCLLFNLVYIYCYAGLRSKELDDLKSKQKIDS